MYTYWIRWHLICRSKYYCILKIFNILVPIKDTKKDTENLEKYQQSTVKHWLWYLLLKISYLAVVYFFKWCITNFLTCKVKKNTKKYL